VHNALTREKAQPLTHRNKEKPALKTGAPKHELETPQNRHITTVETYESASTLQICKRCNPTRTPNIQTAYPSADTENPCQAHVRLNTKAEITFCKHAPLNAGVSCILCFSNNRRYHIYTSTYVIKAYTTIYQGKPIPERISMLALAIPTQTLKQVTRYRNQPADTASPLTQ